MRRLLLALASTAAGLAALISFKTHSSAATSTTVGAAMPQASSGLSVAPGSGSPATPGSGSSAAPGSGTQGTGQPTVSSGGSTASPATRSGGSSGARTASPAARGGTGGATTARTVTGAVASTQYGPMQVQVTLRGSKIISVNVLQRTDVGALSDQIDANAIPQLTRETLAAQSAHIDAVSGASYTSSGYIQSLQDALDHAAA